MSYFHYLKFAFVCCFWLLLINPRVSVGQGYSELQPMESSDETDSITPLKIMVDVSEVRLDVVVLDNKGRQITDLTAADFEIYQNELRQEVTSGIYIDNQADAASSPSVSRKDAPNLLRMQAKALEEEEVRRTIIFVVDNISMQYEDLYRAKTSMKGFLESQMQPGDMVAIIRTSSGNSALQMFTSDKSQINRRIDSIPFAGPTRKIDPGEIVMCEMDEGELHRLYGNQLSTISYSIRALKDMPGRKIMLFQSACPTIRKPPPVVIDAIPTDYYTRYAPHFERLAEDALRAGVVVHSLDARGLKLYEPGALSDEMISALNPLPAKTGGTYIENSNYFTNGIGNDANNMIAGYYLLSYVPPPTTFKASRRDVFHRVEIRVKRRGATVYTRDGFYGRLEEEDSVAPQAAKHPLHDAVFSPFRYADIDVNIAAGYVKDKKAGYLVRSWIHIDPKDVMIVETANGGALIDLETAIFTSDVNGFVQDARHVKYNFNIEPENKTENLAWIKKHGIRFSLLLPVKKPGHYTVRIAIHDTESGRIGSAWQSVEIPDLEKKGMALSNLFMITSAEDLAWMFSDTADDGEEGVFSPVFQDDEVRSPALRTYMPGDRLQTLAILYNADANEIARSEIEMQSILYRDGKEFHRGEPAAITLESADNSDGIAIFRSLTIGSDMPPGDYVLQLLVTDKKNSRKRDNEGVAPQNDGGGLFSKIMRTIISEPKVYSETAPKGVGSQTLSLTVMEP